MIIRKKKELGRLEYYITHLQIINAILPVKLTPKEIELLANFMSLNGSIAEDRFGTTARAIVKNKMNITTAGISNYLKSLKDKRFITDGEIIPILFPDSNEQLYQFKLVNDEAEQSHNI